MDSPSFLSRVRAWVTPPTKGKRKLIERQVTAAEDEEGLSLRRPSKRRHIPAEDLLDGPEQLQRLLPKCGISPPTPSTSSTAALTTPTTRLATFFTPLIKQVLVPNGRALASALFAVYGDIETSSTPSYSTATSSSSCATAPPTPPLPTVRQPASAPPSPPSSTSPSSPPDTDFSQYTYIDLTNDNDDHYDDDNRGGAQQGALHDGSLQQLGEHSHQAREEGEEEEDEDTEWAEQQEQEESSEEAARRLERERSAAEREWREGPLAAALRESAFAPPTASSRPRAPDLLYDMRRFEEREAFRDALRVNRRARRTGARRDHSLPSTSTSTSSILDSIVEERLRRSPPPDLRQTARGRSQHSSSSSSWDHRRRRRHHHQEEEEEEESNEEPEAEQDELSFPSSGRGGRTTFEHERLFWTSLAICESRKRVHDHNSADWLAAINKSRAELENEHSAFERAFVRLRLKEQRRRLKKARAKWLADDRRPFTLEEKALTSRVLRGRAAEVLVTGFNTELTRQDLQRLRDTEWLNDEVINFYLSLLKQRSDDRLKKPDAQQAEAWPRVHFLNTFFYPLLSDKGGYNYARVQKWTRRIDLFAMDRVVVPIHLGNHWCLAVINLQDRRFEYYDSLGSSNRECLQRLRRYLQDEARDKKKIELDLADWGDHQPKDIPLQKNGYDCGVFACKFAECIASGRPFYFSQVDMPIYRKRMMVSILTKTLT